MILTIAGAIIAIVLIVTGIVVVTSSGPSGPPSAGDTVRGYLEALARGDAQAALSYAISPPPDTTLLTSDVLKKQQAKAPISDIRIIESTDTGRVHVLVNFGDTALDETLFLKQGGDGSWKLASAALPVDFKKDEAGARVKLIDAVTLFDEPIPASGRPYVFPGPVEFGTSNPNISVEIENPVYLLGNLEYGVNVDYSFTTTEAGKAAIKKAMMPLVQQCAQSTELSPPGCPQQLGAGGAQGSAAWSAPTSLDEVTFTGDIDEKARQSVTGSIVYTVTLTGSVFQWVNHPLSVAFQGYADMTTQPPGFTFYTG
ncbi:MAG: hypothetical protein PGN37_04735 [Mycobacterium kyogaense]|uniref:hypothetical protein n=1 Tax=Mycobacterium kyogaense TaxID=2212479 RepID=UPI002FFD128D